MHAKFDTFEQVVCRLPDNDVIGHNGSPPSAPYQAYRVSVANDLLHKTDALGLIVFDSKCRKCLNMGNNSSCEKKVYTCNIFID